MISDQGPIISKLPLMMNPLNLIGSTVIIKLLIAMQMKRYLSWLLPVYYSMSVNVLQSKS